jgi:hypothetical protein
MSQDLAQHIQQTNEEMAFGGKMYAYGTEDTIDNPDDDGLIGRIKSGKPAPPSAINRFLMNLSNKQEKLVNPMLRKYGIDVKDTEGYYNDQNQYMRRAVSNDSYPTLQPPPDDPSDFTPVPEAKSSSPVSKRPVNNNLPALDYPAPDLSYKAPGITDLGLPSADMGSLVSDNRSNINFSDPKNDPSSTSFDGTPLKGKGVENTNPSNNLAGNILGAAPLAINAFMAGRTANERPDKVKFGRIQPEEMHPALMDPSSQLSDVSDTFNTANESMAQTSRTDYLRRRIQSATEEAKTKSGVRGNIQNINTQMINAAKERNIQNRMEASRSNVGTQMQEENINAANKGAWQTARDAQLSNLGTSLGEMGRDVKATKANDVYNQRVLEVMKNMGYPINFTMDPKGNLITNRTAGMTIPTMNYEDNNTGQYDDSWKTNPDMAVNPYTYANQRKKQITVR